MKQQSEFKKTSWKAMLKEALYDQYRLMLKGASTKEEEAMLGKFYLVQEEPREVYQTNIDPKLLLKQLLAQDVWTPEDSSSMSKSMIQKEPKELTKARKMAWQASKDEDGLANREFYDNAMKAYAQNKWTTASSLSHLRLMTYTQD